MNLAEVINCFYLKKNNILNSFSNEDYKPVFLEFGNDA